MALLGQSYNPDYDATLASLQAQLESQTAQREAEEQAQRQFRLFIEDKVGGLLGQRESGLARADEIFQALQANFGASQEGLQQFAASRAAQRVSDLGSDPARSTALATLAQFATGGQDGSFAADLAGAASVRGEGAVLAGDELAALTEAGIEAASPLAYAEGIQSQLRPFQYQAEELGKLALMQETRNKELAAKVGGLSSLQELETAGVSTLSGLYSSTQGAFVRPSQTSNVLDALFRDRYNVEGPLSMFG